MCRSTRSSRALRRWLLGCCTFTAVLATAGPVFAQEENWTRDSFGEIGLLEMPSAHLAPDGKIAFSMGDVGRAQRFSLAFQALPWLETAFRYSHFQPGDEFFDRSFSLKARLFNEHDDFADVSIGIRDLLGTGIYSSEYLVASKHVGPVDLTLGAGWGRLADTGALPNPFAQVFSSFNTRAGYVNTGGVVNFGQFFHGPRMGLFGGAAWETPIEGLSLIAEYSSDEYVRERAADRPLFAPRSPVNLGAAYRLDDNISASAGWYYGTTYGFTLTFRGDPFNYTGSEGRLGPVIPPKTVRTDEQQNLAINGLARRNGLQTTVWQPTPAERETQNVRQALFSYGEGVRDVEIQGRTLMINARMQDDVRAQCAQFGKIAAGMGAAATSIAVTDLARDSSEVATCSIQKTATSPAKPLPQTFVRQLRKNMAEQGLILIAASTDGHEAWVYYENNRYQKEAQAAGRIIRLLMRDADPDVEIFHLYPLIGGIPTQKIDVARSPMERLPDDPGMADISQAISLSPAPLYNPVLDAGVSYPKFGWGVAPLLTNEFFTPGNPVGFRLLANLEAALTLAPGLSLATDLNATIFNTFTTDRGADSVLPHVRTDFSEYVKRGSNGISYLGLNYVRRLTPEVFTVLKAGYLEDMFAGAGGEILWRPQGSRFALGADLYEVWQRDFNRLFGLQHYHVLTGHVTLYYESPWYGLNLAVHGGRYLAGDRGATFEVTRRFDSGLEIGAFATFTNVPFKDFGEGSFDKGIILHIPLEWGAPIFTQTSYDMHLQALNRDGGQRLLNDDSLYRVTRPTSVNDLMALEPQMAEP